MQSTNNQKQFDLYHKSSTEILSDVLQMFYKELDKNDAIEFVDQLFIYIHRLYELSIANMYERQKKFNIELRELNESINIEKHSCRWNLKPARDKTLMMDRLIAKRDNAKSKIDSIIQTIVFRIGFGGDIEKSPTQCIRTPWSRKSFCNNSFISISST